MTKEDGSSSGIIVDPVSYRVFMEREHCGCSSGEQVSEPIKRPTPEELQEKGQGSNIMLPED